MKDIFTMMVYEVKAKLTAMLTMLKHWTDPQYIKTQLLNKVKAFFISLLDVKPRHKKDYYQMLGWLISKRLAFAILVIVGTISAYYVFGMNAASLFSGGADKQKTYRYHDMLLRFEEGRVRILGKSGYLAYVGGVKKGSASGQGSLYNPEGNLVYKGNFEDSKYSGTGALYYPNSQIRYEGQFQENLFEGEGNLYRENGSMEYAGAFRQGYKDGQGTLFDAANNKVYEGRFSRDQLQYRDFLGKSTGEVSEIYTGKKMIYMDEDYFAVLLHDINAVYYGESDTNLLDESMQVTGIYVLQNYFYRNGMALNNIVRLSEQLGVPSYEGNSVVTMPEAAAIINLKEENEQLYGAVSMETQAAFDDVIEVLSYDTDYMIYLYSYEDKGLYYTFFCKDKMGEFDFYKIEKAKEEESDKETQTDAADISK